MKIMQSFWKIAFVSLIAWSLYGCAVLKTPTPAPTPTSKPAPTQTPIPARDSREYLEVFEEVWSTINETYFDPDFGGLDWNAIHAKYAPLILGARDDEALYRHLNRMLWELNVSHTGVGPVEVWPSIEPVAWGKGETGLDVRLLAGQAVITRVKTGSPAEVAGLRPGFIIQSIESLAVEQILDNAKGNLSPPYNDRGYVDGLTRRLLSEIYGEPGTCVTLVYLDEKDELHEKCIERARRPRVGEMGDVLPPASLEFESRSLESHIGYIRFNTFHPDLIPDMVAAVAGMRDAPGVIIDLRGNLGGDAITCERLAVQFLDGQAPFGSFKFRSETINRLLTGENIYPGPLVILIDTLSYSGSEYFSSGMQSLGRAVIIGEHSPGGAVAMAVKALPNGAILGYPIGQLITVDGKVLEGIGVVPDIPVSLERSQLLEGLDAQLQAAIDYLIETGR